MHKMQELVTDFNKVILRMDNDFKHLNNNEYYQIEKEMGKELGMDSNNETFMNPTHHEEVTDEMYKEIHSTLHRAIKTAEFPTRVETWLEVIFSPATRKEVFPKIEEAMVREIGDFFGHIFNQVLTDQKLNLREDYPAYQDLKDLRNKAEKSVSEMVKENGK